MRRALAMGGFTGPAAFVLGWVILETQLTHYSPVSDAISEIARAGRSTHPLMTLAFVVYGVSMLAFAASLLRLSRFACISAVINGLTTIGVAASPLGSADGLHFAFAAIAYVSLALMPLFMRQRWFGATIAVALLVSVVGPTDVHGLFQRIGLTIGDIWTVSIAWRLVRPVGS